ncbi:DNA cytosine methyltransferase [Planctomicrobium piriforme]|uniref:Cytosine-specific methyltransferase n=1 Tax=Planctomicrobium piriforme TaxID=1576369 RepID=A0A1I3DNE9_9PLAN|nr:DNA cytosine methyltransferase [Planctomicrobium piriforme]SFH88236.1 DNA (cytosine-5)-methyltransferase 1 [Planctomicrobium piriforme]
MKIPTISLFAGCGGLDLGAEKAGAKVVFANDINEDSCSTLKKYFPKITVFQGDISTASAFPDADLVIGGYPCQSFSMGGKRNPVADKRTQLYQEFGRCLKIVKPRYFLAENVSGLKKLQNGEFLQHQIDLFDSLGYRLSTKMVNACDYGVPQKRKRLIIVGVRNDLRKAFCFPSETHGRATRKHPGLIPYTSHGDAIRHLPLWPAGEFYERPHDPDGHMSWYYMSRNRKSKWDEPSYTIVANWRHVTLHPACPTMTLTWSNLSDGWKQRWDFSKEYEHLDTDSSRPILSTPRRLSWRECAAIQTFPADFTPVGKVESIFTQIGNAVPPLLAETILRPLLNGEGLVRRTTSKETLDNNALQQLLLWN